MNPQTLYAWAPGYDVALGSLIRITSVTASGDQKPFPAPQCQGFFDPGDRSAITNGLDFFSGYNSTALYFAALTWNQYAYIYNTILSGAFSGPVTLFLRLGFDAYTRKNAVLHLPTQVETDAKFYSPKKVTCPVTRLRNAA